MTVSLISVSRVLELLAEVSAFEADGSGLEAGGMGLPHFNYWVGR